MKRLLFVLSFLVSTSTAYSQDWMPITSKTGVQPYYTPYFLNANVGFTFNAGITWEMSFLFLRVLRGDYGSPKLARTTNGGLTWSALTFFDSSGYSITQLSFVSLTHGYASAVPNYDFNHAPVSGGIFETSDQGDHWKKITSDGPSFSSVYATNHTVFASEFFPSKSGNLGQPIVGGILYSRDDGKTWDSVTNVAGLTLGAQPQFQFIYGNRDSLVATIYYTNNTGSKGNNGKTYLVFSTDLGKTWNSSLLDQGYLWPMVSLHISPHSCHIVREFVDYNRHLDTYSFLESSPPYDSWGSGLMNKETGAWIAGASCASYVSDAADGGPTEDVDSSVCLFRSIDGGVSWLPIHKEHGNNPYFTEIDDEDFQNLSVVGYGAVVYAFDFNFYTDSSRLWKTTDGGDGTLSASALAPQFALGHSPFGSSQDTLFLSSCSPSNVEAYNQNIGCSFGKFDSISIVGLDPSEYSIISTHHCACQPMSDTSFITLHLNQTGARNVTLHYHFTDDEYNQLDTSTSFTIIGSSSSGTSGQLHREAASAYFGGFDSLTLAVDINSSINLDSLWSFITDMQFSYGWDSSVVSFSSYLAPAGWPVVSTTPHGNSVDISIHNASSAATNPLGLGTAIFTPNNSGLASSWVMLPQLLIVAGGQTISLCVAENEDSHWAVKTLGASSGVTFCSSSYEGDVHLSQPCGRGNYDSDPRSRRQSRDIYYYRSSWPQLHGAAEWKCARYFFSPGGRLFCERWRKRREVREGITIGITFPMNGSLFPFPPSKAISSIS